MMLGFGMATTRPAAAMLIAALYVYIRRMASEEAALEPALGAAYSVHAARRTEDR